MTDKDKIRIGNWQKEKIAAVNLHVKKGVRDQWKRYADALGLTLVDFIRQAVDEKAEREGIKEIVAEEDEPV